MCVSTLTRGIAAQTCPDIMLKIAATCEEREAVFRLVYDSYQRAGLCKPSASHLRCTPYQLLPTTDIFFAELREEAICTMSLVRDGELGLPMEELYPQQVLERRNAGLRVAEVSCLADRRQSPKRFFDLFCDLSRLMVQLAVAQGVDQLLIAVHPRHVALYRRYLGFECIGEERDYGLVNGNPAVPLCLDLDAARANLPLWNKYFGQEIPAEVLEPQPMATLERAYFLDLLAESEAIAFKQGCSLPQEDDWEAAEFGRQAEDVLLCA